MPKTALVIGASRTLGLAAARELAQRGWRVIATARSANPEELQKLAAEPGVDVILETLDMNERDQIVALKERLRDEKLDLLYINAGIADEDLPVGQVETQVFIDVMVTNALSPMRVVEDLSTLVKPGGIIAVVSSRQGSISFNTRGGHEVYRASKSALNQLMRSYAIRADNNHTLLLLHPGWVQTELGGAGAALTVDESARGLINTVEKHGNDGGLQFIDYAGEIVPW